MKIIIFFTFLGITQPIFSQISGDGVIDIDGNIYSSVIINKVEWMSENLKTTHYNNGDEIPYVSTNSDWSNSNSGAFCWYNNDDDNKAIYGNIYNIYALNDIRGICPEGWEVPTENDWIKLVEYLGGSTEAGGPLKAVSNLWNPPNGGATNLSGFSALPSGRRWQAGLFQDLNERAYLGFIEGSSTSIARKISYFGTSVSYLGGYDNTGVCVRCIKNEVLGIDINNKSSQIKMYPNPFQDELNISLSPNEIGNQFKIVDILGRVVISGELTVSENKLNLSDLNPGLYLFIYQDYSNKIIKK